MRLLRLIKDNIVTVVLAVLGVLAAFFAISSNRKDDQKHDERLRADNAVDANDKKRHHEDAADAVSDVLDDNKIVSDHVAKASDRQKKAAKVVDVEDDQVLDYINRGE